MAIFNSKQLVYQKVIHWSFCLVSKHFADEDVFEMRDWSVELNGVSINILNLQIYNWTNGVYIIQNPSIQRSEREVNRNTFVNLQVTPCKLT